MNAKEILAQLKKLVKKDAFDTTPAPPAAVPPTAPADTSTGGTVYTLQDGTQISIAQAGATPAAGDAVTIAGAPAPAGVLVLQDGSQITTDAGGIITAYAGATAAAVTPTAPAPTVESRLAAIEAALAKLTPAPMTCTKDEFDAQSKIISEWDEKMKLIVQLSEALVKEPTAEPKTLNGTKKEKLDKQQKIEQRFEAIAAAIKANKVK